MQDRLSIELVDSQDRTLVTLNSEVGCWNEQSALKAISQRIARWHGAKGGYARNSDNALVAYR